MKYKIIQDLQYDTIPVSRKAELLRVNRRSYYKWLQRPPPDSQCVQQEMRISDELQKIAIEFPRYGYRRMTIELHNRGYLVNHKKVLRLMKEDNLLCVKKQFKPLTTDSNHPHTVYIQTYYDTNSSRILIKVGQVISHTFSFQNLLCIWR